MQFSRPRMLFLASTFCLAVSSMATSAKQNPAQDQTQAAGIQQNLTDEGKKNFLLTAKVIRSKQSSKGVTRPYTLTLSDGKMTVTEVMEATGFGDSSYFAKVFRRETGMSPRAWQRK